MYNYNAAQAPAPPSGPYYPNTPSGGYAQAVYQQQTYSYPSTYAPPGPSGPSSSYSYGSLNGHGRGPVENAYTPQAAPPHSNYYPNTQPPLAPPVNGGYAPAPIPAPRAPLPNVNAIPAPSQPTTYQPPMFKTFQERKREREMALRTTAQSNPTPPPSHDPTPAPSPHVSRFPPTSPSTPLHALPHIPGPPQHAGPVPSIRAPFNGVGGAPTPPAHSPINGPPQFSTPPPAALAMMAQQNGAAVGRPTPPPRSSSGPAPWTGNRPPVPAPRGVSSPATSPSKDAPWGAAPVTAPAPPDRRSVSPAPPDHRSPSPGPPTTTPHINYAQPPAHVPTPQPPTMSSPAASAPLPSSSNPPSLTPSLRNKAISSLLDRSDTVSSIKSVDRAGFGPKRSLPKPPAGLASSRSLDRGPALPGNPRAPRRGEQSPVRMSAIPAIPGISEVDEEGPAELAARFAGVSVGGFVPVRQSPEKPTVGLPASPSPAPFTKGFPNQQCSQSMPSIHVGGHEVPTINVGGPEIPTINVGGPDVPTIVTPSSPKTSPAVPIINVPSISVGSPPTIAVSPPAVPNITFGDDDNGTISRPESPNGFAISGLPTIAVSSGDTRDELPPISISVPSVKGPSSTRQSSRPSHNSAGPSRIHPDMAILCAGCHNPIIGRIVSAMKQRYHPQCFSCGTCGELLEHVSSYEHEGKPYCHLDYHDKFAHKCHHCQTPIVDPRFVTLNDDVLGERYYHELHFFCSECGDPFLDPSKSSAAGTEANRDGDDEANETNAFVIHKGHPYCEGCHLRLHKPKCRECRKPIPDVAVSAMGAKYHRECFVCKRCTRPFANNLFFPMEGEAFCTECFESMQ